MLVDQYRKKIPLLQSWVTEQLAQTRAQSKIVSDLKFTRLSEYFSKPFLEATRVVLVDRVPIPPLASFGIEGLSEFEQGDFSGITYLDTFFIKKAEAANESLFFHELVHVIQWRLLGAERFLMAYAEELLRGGYKRNAFEIMANFHQGLFDKSHIAYDVEKAVKSQMGFS